MSEDSNTKSSSTSQTEEEKKKQSQTAQAAAPEQPKQPAAPAPAPPSAAPAVKPAVAAAPAPSPARPAAPASPAPPAARPAALPPRPAAPRPPPTPPARPAQPKSSGRRTFLKALVAVGAILSVAPFVPWGSFLSSSVASTGAYKRQKATLDLNTVSNRNVNGNVAGKTVNVNDLNSFPPNSTWLLTYPSSGDLTVDSQNPDTFVKFGLIRLPAELGGTAKDASAFVAFSKVCVHLWCSPNYNPSTGHEQYECPCHGSIYRVPDALSVAGPASQQPAPTNAEPMLTLTADQNGDLYVEPPLWDVDHNGVIGYGRFYRSYENYILPAAEGKGTTG